MASVSRFLERIEDVNESINAFCSIVSAEVLQRDASESLARWRSGTELSPLDGVLVSVKDTIAQRGQACRLGSEGRPDVPATTNAPAMEKLLAAGMIIVGRTTMPDHGIKATTHGGLHGTARNPWDPALTPGGSSGGGAASVAAGLTRIAVGSDGGGSLRIPAAFCGIVGFKPTHGRVPVTPGGPFDDIGHQGPLAASVREAAALLDVISHPAAPRTAPMVQGIDLSGLSYTVWQTDTIVDPAIQEGIDRTVATLAVLGGADVPRAANDLDRARALNAWEFTFRSGAAAAVQAMPPGAKMDPSLADLARIGASFTDHDRQAARDDRASVRRSVDELFHQVDILVSPVTATLPFAVGHDVPPGSDLTYFHEWSPWTHPFNVTGNPAISIPTGLSDSGLPTAVHLVAGRGRDGLLLQVAAQLEAALGAPPLPDLS
ncbi:amidase [Nocardioides endophyticus]|uniref:amidase n=1 Tax=Nocardioides endophyticus TaxID=1353775 RepID=UPI0031E9A888